MSPSTARNAIHDELTAPGGLPASVAQTTLVAYRSVGIGLFGAGMRFVGMPLEKIALYMNSSQVSGRGQFAQAVRLTFQDGALAPYRVVGPSSIRAWFLQYSVMGIAFQFVDRALSQALDVRPMYYGAEIMSPATPGSTPSSPQERAKFTAKTILAPIIAALLESKVSNRAEAQRYFGVPRFQAIQQTLPSTMSRVLGPAFAANTARNVIMCQTSFVLTPLTYKFYFPQEEKSVQSLFWFGLAMNIFVGNVLAITQQALWGRSLDYLATHGTICYRSVVLDGLRKDGIAAFFTIPKWFSRVLMNAPAQGTLPWFYNNVLPLGEQAALQFAKDLVYDRFLVKGPSSSSGVGVEKMRHDLEDATGTLLEPRQTSPPTY